MSYVARILDRIVVEVVQLPNGVALADAFHPDAGFVAAKATTRVGMTYADGEFGPIPEPEPEEQEAPRLSFLEFMDLFTEDEQLAIAGAAMSDVSTKLWYDRAVGAQFISLDDSRLAVGLQALVDDELISTSRRDSVLLGLGPAV